MKSSTILLIFFFILSFLTNGQKRNCSELKRGTFKSYTKQDGNRTIERQSGKEICLYVESKLKMEFEIEWLDNCSYRKRLTEVLENPNNVEVYYGDEWYTVEIIDWNNEGYVERLTNKTYNITLDIDWEKEN